MQFVVFQLPIKIDIIKHAHEIDGKSTAIHAAILAPEDVKIYTYPDFPDISDKEEVRGRVTIHSQALRFLRIIIDLRNCHLSDHFNLS